LAIPRQRISLPARGWREALRGFGRGELWDGPDLERFERAFAGFVGLPEALAVPSGRAGLRFILEALRLEPGSEILCSAFGYPVVPHLAHALGFSVRFVDCELGTLGMDPEALERAISERTRAVIATHLYGVPCRIREIAKLTEAHDAALIEDCAHSLGASVDRRHAGAFGQAGYFSFETSKPINTLGGGMVATRDPELARRMRELASAQPHHDLGWLTRRLARTSFEATVTHPLVFNLGVYPALRLARRASGPEDRFASGYHADEVTLQGRMGRYSNYQARLGQWQLDQLAPRLERRNANAERLITALRKHVTLQQPGDADSVASYMLVTARVPDLEAFADELLRRGVDSKHHYMRDCSRLFDDAGEFPNAARAEREVLHLPAYPELGSRQLDRVAAAVESVAASLGSATRPTRS
jgi:dTDP-4-amino-4,6-dideoxygalactose transaminase